MHKNRVPQGSPSHLPCTKLLDNFRQRNKRDTRGKLWAKQNSSLGCVNNGDEVKLDCVDGEQGPHLAGGDLFAPLMSPLPPIFLLPMRSRTWAEVYWECLGNCPHQRDIIIKVRCGSITALIADLKRAAIETSGHCVWQPLGNHLRCMFMTEIRCNINFMNVKHAIMGGDT